MARVSASLVKDEAWDVSKRVIATVVKASFILMHSQLIYVEGVLIDGKPTYLEQ
jgi:hypothetical protein